MKDGRMKIWICILLCAAMLPGLAAGEGSSGVPEDFNMVRRLNELGYFLIADSSSEEELRAAIEDFQTANGMDVTGEADDLTLIAMQSETAVSKSAYLSMLAGELENTGAIASGSYGEAVERLQRALRNLGYFSEPCDGNYGDTTEFAVSRFQLANGLTETGIADKTVLYRLYSGAPTTWDEFVIENTASVGDAGDNVRMLQIWLKHMSFFQGECTGVFGEQTQQAVKRYQSHAELEPTGNVDSETAERLFMDAARALSAGATVRRGDSGKRAAEMCEKLRILGYPAHEVFDLQTELALMLFQNANGLEVTGEADSATMASIRLRAQDGVPEENVSAAEMQIDASAAVEALRQAQALLGQPAEFDSDFAFVQYVYLKSGVLLTAEAVSEPVPLPEGSPLTDGKAVHVETENAAAWGISAADGSVILCGGKGYIVKYYLDMMNVERVCVARNMM